MFTQENLVIAILAIGVVFLILGLLILSNTHKLLKNQHKDFDLLIEYLEERLKPTFVGVDISKKEAIEEANTNLFKATLDTLIEIVSSVDTKVQNADFQAIRIAIDSILHQIKLGDLDGTKAAIYTIIENQNNSSTPDTSTDNSSKSLKGISEALNTILENQKSMGDAKANITISALASDNPTQQVNNNLKLTSENIDEIVSKLKPFLNENAKETVVDTNNTGSLILATIGVTEVILAELHDVETIYNDKGEVLEKIHEDYNKTYEVIFKVLTENLL